MIRGKLLYANCVNLDALDELERSRVYIVNKNRTVKLERTYELYNWIVIPGREVFVLKNPETGKMTRSKIVFIEKKEA